MNEKCKHEWENDPIFEDGSVIMLFGPVGNVKREMRQQCRKCGAVKYVGGPTGGSGRRVITKIISFFV